MRRWVVSTLAMALAAAATHAHALTPACPTLEYTIAFATEDDTVLSSDANDAMDALMSSVRRCDGVTFALTTALSRPLDHLRADAVRNALIDRGASAPAISEVPGTHAPINAVTILVFSQGTHSE